MKPDAVGYKAQKWKKIPARQRFFGTVSDRGHTRWTCFHMHPTYAEAVDCARAKIPQLPARCDCALHGSRFLYQPSDET